MTKRPEELLYPELSANGEPLIGEESPRIPLDDPLLAALRREHGEARPDIVEPRTSRSG